MMKDMRENFLKIRFMGKGNSLKLMEKLLQDSGKKINFYGKFEYNLYIIYLSKTIYNKLINKCPQKNLSLFFFSKFFRSKHKLNSKLKRTQPIQL